MQPSAEHASLALREAAVLMAPIALWLLRHGVSYPAFADMLKTVFLRAARAELERADTNTTQSALSLLSGVHRKDVRAIALEPATVEPRPRPSLASQVLTRWLTDARYRAADGGPRTLPRAGTRRSFETLCRESSSDVHPRAVLDELLRLGQVRLEGNTVVATAASFVPSARLDESTSLFTSNAADHIAAAVGNLTLNAPKSLEQSIYADGLTPASIDMLHLAAREAWSQAFQSMATQARERVDLDAKSDGNLRMRFGVYFFSEAVATPAGPAPALRRGPRQRRDPTRRKIEP